MDYLIFIWEMERTHMTDDLTGADQKIQTDWLKTLFLERLKLQLIKFLLILGQVTPHLVPVVFFLLRPLRRRGNGCVLCVFKAILDQRVEFAERQMSIQYKKKYAINRQIIPNRDHLL